MSQDVQTVSADLQEEVVPTDETVEVESIEVEPIEELDEEPVDESIDVGALGVYLEAALMSTDRPVPSSRLGEVVATDGKKVNGRTIKKAVESLNEHYASSGRSFRVEQVAGGWQIITLPEYAEVAAGVNKTRAQTRLSPAALEALAVIAYKQPVLKADVEAIRGVACGEIIRSLMERRLVKIVGRAEELGRPMLYGTTKSFLEVFGMSNLKDLPNIEELKQKK